MNRKQERNKIMHSGIMQHKKYKKNTNKQVCEALKFYNW